VHLVVILLLGGAVVSRAARPLAIRGEIAKSSKMPSGSKPGERRGGRQKGTPNKKTVGLAGVPAPPPIVPVSKLRALDEMRLAATLLRNIMVKAVNAMLEGAETNVAFVSQTIKNYIAAQREVAPYEDSKQVSVKVGGDQATPIRHEWNLSRLTDEQLAALGPIRSASEAS
jgi:hypothetical protein